MNRMSAFLGKAYISFTLMPNLLPKLSHLKIIAKKSWAAVISVTESWLDSSVTDSEVAIENYCVVRRDKNRSGGGVCMYIRCDLAFCVKDFSSEQNEALWIELYLPKTKPVLVGRLPKQTDFLEHFENGLSKLRSDCETIVLGEFNICYQQKTSSLFKSYTYILRMFSMKQII